MQARDLLPALPRRSTPRFAPAWARLGRCHRVIGKYIERIPDSDAQAEEAFRRALELNPRLTVAHKFYANLEADTGQRRTGDGAAARRGEPPRQRPGALRRARPRVPVLRPLRASLAAHAEARRLESARPDECRETLLLQSEFEKLLSGPGALATSGPDTSFQVIALGLAGRRDEARQVLPVVRAASQLPTVQTWFDYLLAWLERRTDDMDAWAQQLKFVKIQYRPGGHLPSRLAPM